VPTQPDAGDPLGSQYGDAGLVRSESISGRVWTPIDTLTPELKDQKVSIWYCIGRASVNEENLLDVKVGHSLYTAAQHLALHDAMFM
jgi:hypothetical protein